jgi:MarR family transcriptional regulator for hemolysin
MERLDDILFYTLEKSIKTYRQFAQRAILKEGFELTIDQWLVLKAIMDNPDWSQQEIAEASFKDIASVTRIIELLVKKGFLKRTIHPVDRRRFLLTPTTKASQDLKSMQPVTEQNRKTALYGLKQEEIARLQEYLSVIIKNCNTI